MKKVEEENQEFEGSVEMDLYTAISSENEAQKILNEIKCLVEEECAFKWEDLKLNKGEEASDKGRAEASVRGTSSPTQVTSAAAPSSAPEGTSAAPGTSSAGGVSHEKRTQANTKPCDKCGKDVQKTNYSR